MRLVIKNGNKTNGANGARRAPGADEVVTSTSARHGATRPAIATLLRSIDATTAEVKEALLQILSGVTPYVPRFRVRETNQAVVIVGCLTHVDADSVEVTLAGRTLEIHGGTSNQHERNRRTYRSLRKVYRTFERTIPIHCDVDRKDVVATLRDGLLRIHVPRKQPSPEQSKSEPLDFNWPDVSPGPA